MQTSPDSLGIVSHGNSPCGLDKHLVFPRSPGPGPAGSAGARGQRAGRAKAAVRRHVGGPGTPCNFSRLHVPLRHMEPPKLLRSPMSQRAAVGSQRVACEDWREGEWGHPWLTARRGRKYPPCRQIQGLSRGIRYLSRLPVFGTPLCKHCAVGGACSLGCLAYPVPVYRPRILSVTLAALRN